MSVTKFIVNTLLQNTLNTTGNKVGEAIGERVAGLIKPKEEVRSPHWSWMLFHNISLAVMATVVRKETCSESSCQPPP